MLGKDIIHELVHGERTIGHGGEYHVAIVDNDTTQAVNKKIDAIVKLLLAVAHAVCGHYVRRTKAIENSNSDNANFSPPQGGECWRDAFGDVLVVDLSLGFQRLSNMLTEHIAPVNLILNASVGSMREFLRNNSNVVACELEELMLPMNTIRYIVLDDVLVIQGDTGLVFQIGHVRSLDMSLWHICSMEQACEFYNAPTQFIATVNATRPESLIHNELEMESYDFRSPRLVLVGAPLVNPIQVRAIETFDMKSCILIG